MRASFITQIRKYETVFLSVQRSTVCIISWLIRVCRLSLFQDAHIGHVIKNLLTSTVRAVRGNIKPRSLAIARSIQQDPSLIFALAGLTLNH